GDPLGRPDAARLHRDPLAGTTPVTPSSGCEGDLGQLRPARLRALPSRLGEPLAAEAAPRFPLDPGRVRVGTIRQSPHDVARREQPRGLLVLAAAQRQVGDPDEYL